MKHWCKHPECKGKFSGFKTATELKAHAKEKHGEGTDEKTPADVVESLLAGRPARIAVQKRV